MKVTVLSCPRTNPLYVGDGLENYNVISMTDEQFMTASLTFIKNAGLSKVELIRAVRNAAGVGLLPAKIYVDMLLDGGYKAEQQEVLLPRYPLKEAWADTIHVRFNRGGFVILGVENFFDGLASDIQKLDALYKKLQQDECAWRDNLKGTGLELLFSQGAEHSMCAGDIVEFHHTNSLKGDVVEVRTYCCTSYEWTKMILVPETEDPFAA